MTSKRKKPIATKNPEYDADYDAFIHGLELVGLGVKSCRCDLDRTALFAAPKRVKLFDQKYRITELMENSFDAEGNFELTISESEEKAPAVRMECVYEIHFHGESPLVREHCERFAASELKLILAPMARQFFFSLSGQMSIAPIVLPLTTRFAQKLKKNAPPEIGAVSAIEG